MSKCTPFPAIGFLLLCSFFLYSNHVNAQEDSGNRINFYLSTLDTITETANKLSVIDNAIREFKVLKDTSAVARFYKTKSKLLLNISELDSARITALLSLNFSNAIKDTLAMGSVLMNLIKIEGEASRYEKAHMYADSALILYQTKNKVNNIASVLNSRSSVYQYQGSLLQAEETLLESLRLSKENQNYINQARVYTNLGINVKDMGRYLDAVQYLKKAEFLADSLLNQKPHPGYISIYNAFATTYNRVGLFDLAIKYVEKCRHVCNSIGDPDGEVIFSSAMSDIFAKQGKNDLAKQYVDSLKSYSRNEKLGPRKRASVYSFIGKYYSTIDDFEKAKKWYLKSLKIFESIGRKPSIANLNQLLGELYGEDGQLDTAKQYITRSAKIAKSVGDLQWPIKEYGSLGVALMESGLYKEAIPLLLKAEKVADSLSMRNTQRELYGYLFDAYSKTGNSDDGIEYSIKLMEIDEQLDNDKVAMAVAEANASYKVESLSSDLKQTRLSRLKEQLQHKKEKARSNQLMGVFVLFALVALITAFFQRRISRLRKEKNRQLSNQNFLLDDKNKHLELQTQVINGQKLALEENNIKLNDELGSVRDELELVNLEQNKYIQLKNKLHIRPLSIYYIEPHDTVRNNIKLYCEQHPNGIKDRQTLSSILAQLPNDFFVKINKSNIVNLKKIKEVRTNDLITANNQYLKISPNFKTEFEEKHQKLLLK